MSSPNPDKFAIVHGRRVGGWVLHVPRACRVSHDAQWYGSWSSAIGAMDRLLEEYRRRLRGERHPVPAQQERLYS